MANNSLRLNVYLANAGLCSRRAAGELIKKGEITINHGVVTNPGYQILEKDTVRYKKKVIKLGQNPLITYVLNKPENYITSVSDEYDRPTVMDFVSTKSRVYPIGRLDYNTSGVLLLTNDGELAQFLAHPKHQVKKIYLITLAKDLTAEHLAMIKRGLFLHDGPIKVDAIECTDQRKRVKVTIHSGKNRIVRRIFESLGYTVRKLDRINFGGISKRGLPLGETRILTETEIAKLKSNITLKRNKKEIA
jgi:23S rRNA pseudouridine2605 synthase